MTTLKEMTEKLQTIDRARGASFVRDFEDVLADIAALRDPASIPMLLRFFEDDAAYEELMFSIIHTIEAFDDPVYVAALLAETRALWRQSPRWTSILYMRVLNSKPTCDELVRQVSLAPEIVRSSLREVLNRIVQERPQFRSVADTILAE